MIASADGGLTAILPAATLVSILVLRLDSRVDIAREDLPLLRAVLLQADRLDATTRIPTNRGVVRRVLTLQGFAPAPPRVSVDVIWVPALCQEM